MGSPRKTKLLKYDLKDRGRKLTGQDRSNVDIAAMVDQINSPKTQEMVNTGSLVGFYGHQIRQRFGLFPPETALIDGKAVRLEPAFKTNLIKANLDGTVEHQHEFLDNESGEFARRQYLANGGGFSTAVTYRPSGTKLIPTVFAGFDFVWQPNYATNVGDGQLFDGLFVAEGGDGMALFDGIGDGYDPVAAMLAHTLELQIIQNFDSIHSQIALSAHAEQAIDQVGALLKENQVLRDRQAKRAALQRTRQQDIYDGISGKTRSFDVVLAEAQQFAQIQQQQGKDLFDAISDEQKKEPYKWLKLGFGLGF